MKIPEKIMQKALRLAAKALPDYPEDDWVELSPVYDLNLYTERYQDTVLFSASIYRVEVGATITDEWVRVLEFRPEGANAA